MHEHHRACSVIPTCHYLSPEVEHAVLGERPCERHHRMKRHILIRTPVVQRESRVHLHDSLAYSAVYHTRKAPTADRVA